MPPFQGCPHPQMQEETQVLCSVSSPSSLLSANLGRASPTGSLAVLVMSLTCSSSLRAGQDRGFPKTHHSLSLDRDLARDRPCLFLEGLSIQVMACVFPGLPAG